MTEPKTTGVWSHLRERFPAANKYRQTLARQDNITSGFSTNTMDLLYIHWHLTFLEQTSSISNSGKPRKKVT